jgi:hypothetical protein
MESGRYLIREIEANHGTGNSGVAAQTQNEVPQHFFQELKKAYGAVLSEKEGMIIQLKSEIDNLKKINILLEREIDRIGSESRSRNRTEFNDVEY